MIEIIQAEKVEALSPIPIDTWSCWLEISQGDEAWMLPATAPGNLAQAELQAYFEAQEADLWRVAQNKRYPVDVWQYIPHRRLLRAAALVILDEVNILRSWTGMLPRTPEQVVAAIKAKLQ